MSTAPWYSIDDNGPAPTPLARLRAAWRGAPVEAPELLDMLLETAKEDVLAYAPHQDAPAAVITDTLTRLGQDADTVAAVLALLNLEAPADLAPKRWVYAQLMQAKNLWNAGTVSSDGDTGADGYTFTPRPLDKTIRQLIRPLDGTPHVL